MGASASSNGLRASAARVSRAPARPHSRRDQKNATSSSASENPTATARGDPSIRPRGRRFSSRNRCSPSPVGGRRSDRPPGQQGQGQRQLGQRGVGLIDRVAGEPQSIAGGDVDRLVGGRRVPGIARPPGPRATPATGRPRRGTRAAPNLSSATRYPTCPPFRQAAPVGTERSEGTRLFRKQSLVGPSRSEGTRLFRKQSLVGTERSEGTRLFRKQSLVGTERSEGTRLFRKQSLVGTERSEGTRLFRKQSLVGTERSEGTRLFRKQSLVGPSRSGGTLLLRSSPRPPSGPGDRELALDQAAVGAVFGHQAVVGAVLHDLARRR